MRLLSVVRPACRAAVPPGSLYSSLTTLSGSVVRLHIGLLSWPGGTAPAGVQRGGGSLGALRLRPSGWIPVQRGVTWRCDGMTLWLRRVPCFKALRGPILPF